MHKIDKSIDKWKNKLGLTEWFILVENIDPNAVTYDDDCPLEDRYYVGIEPNHTKKIATIYHDRDLTEEDIIHELLHVRYPDWTEDKINEETEILIRLDHADKHGLQWEVGQWAKRYIQEGYSHLEAYRIAHSEWIK